MLVVGREFAHKLLMASPTIDFKSRLARKLNLRIRAG
jgi:hypothetical protein